MNPRTPASRADGPQLDRWILDHRRGDPEAGSRLVHDLLPRVRAFLYRMTGDREETDDLSQETFTRFFEGLGGYRPEGRAVSYVLRIAANGLKNRRRDRREHPGGDHLARIPVEAPGPLDRAMAVDRATRVSQALLAVPVSDRGALILREYHGLDYCRIAAVLDTTEGAIKQRIFRARRVLRERLLEGSTPAEVNRRDL